jgi:hypothetical protein
LTLVYAQTPHTDASFCAYVVKQKFWCQEDPCSRQLIIPSRSLHCLLAHSHLPAQLEKGWSANLTKAQESLAFAQPKDRLVLKMNLILEYSLYSFVSISICLPHKSIWNHAYCCCAIQSKKSLCYPYLHAPVSLFIPPGRDHV